MDLTLELKESTKDAHKAIESLPVMRRLQMDDASFNDYKSMAVVMFPKLWQLEHHLAEFLKKLSLSRDAMTPLALECSEMGLTLSVSGSLPKNENFHIALLYVLEGSNLGAKFLMSIWKQTFSNQDISSMHYYNYLSGFPSTRWIMVKEILNSLPLSMEQRQEILEYSEKIFLFLGGVDDVFKTR